MAMRNRRSLSRCRNVVNDVVGVVNNLVDVINDVSLFYFKNSREKEKKQEWVYFPICINDISSEEKEEEEEEGMFE